MKNRIYSVDRKDTIQVIYRHGVNNGYGQTKDFPQALSIIWLDSRWNIKPIDIDWNFNFYISQSCTIDDARWVCALIADGHLDIDDCTNYRKPITPQKINKIYDSLNKI